jgi:hypothetical protein
VARGRWSSLERTLVGGRTSLVVFIDCPVARPIAALRRVMGLLLRESGRRENEALLSGPLGSGPSCPGAKLPNRGVRERPNTAAGCHAAPKGNRSYCCEYSRVDAGKQWHRPQCVCRQRGCACGSERLQGSQTSLNSNCQKNRRKHFSSSTTPRIACDVVVQRLPTVRMVGEVGNGEYRAKTTDIKTCASTAE